MGIGTAKAKRVHANNQTAMGIQGPVFLHHLQAVIGQRQARIQRADTDGGRYRALP